MKKTSTMLPHAKLWTLTGLAAVLLGAQTAAPVTVLAAPTSAPAVIASAASEQVYNRFLEMVQAPNRIGSSLAYLRAHITEVTPYQASLMVLRLENALKRNLPAIEERFFASSIQETIGSVYQPGFGFGDVRSRISDTGVQQLLNQASAQGYKLETAEGMYYPIINYSIFREFQEHVNEDIRTYINIMAEESKQASVKDAALVIGYQQLVRRTLAMEQFVLKFPNSNRTADVKERFELYKSFTFYGTNNTPLFDYETKAMKENARTGYTNILQWVSVESSPYLDTLAEFMDLAAANDYQETAEIRDFVRNQVSAN
ncbi:hypothetical protein [Paenibacillus sp. 1P07SE]|uniref:hypothetical protein n=1 Tax=Paenibacillus sp. 1P07SE TaxID=3132209 RepID=UPI0039A6F95D